MYVIVPVEGVSLGNISLNCLSSFLFLTLIKSFFLKLNTANHELHHSIQTPCPHLGLTPRCIKPASPIITSVSIIFTRTISFRVQHNAPRYSTVTYREPRQFIQGKNHFIYPGRCKGGGGGFSAYSGSKYNIRNKGQTVAVPQLLSSTNSTGASAYHCNNHYTLYFFRPKDFFAELMLLFFLPGNSATFHPLIINHKSGLSTGGAYH